MKRIIASLLISLGLVAVPLSGTVVAMDLFPDTTCADQDCGVVKASDTTLGAKVQNIINVAIYLIGGIAVIMLIVGAIRMAVAQGDPGNIKAGRLAVLWSLVGVAIALLASAIVNFVINWNWLK
jgi:hypothetical protein